MRVRQARLPPFVAVGGLLLVLCARFVLSVNKLCCDPDCARELAPAGGSYTQLQLSLSTWRLWLLDVVLSLCSLLRPLSSGPSPYFLFLEPISLARTRVRYIPKEKQFLSFPARASVTVYAKNVGNEDLWEGMVLYFTCMLIGAVLYCWYMSHL